MAKIINDDRTKPIYASYRFNDVLSYAEGKDFLRVLFDDEKNLFLYCNGWDYIHIFLGQAAISCGLYPQSSYSKISKNLGLFEFTLSKEYREGLIKQDSYSYVKEFNGFYIYTREGSELLKNPVFKKILKPYVKKKEITIEERIRRLEKKLFETLNLHGANRVAGFYYTKTGKWELLPRTEEDVFKNNATKAIFYSHNSDSDWLEETSAIRFAIETNENDKTLCVIESPKLNWLKQFIRKLYQKFPEEMSMVDLFNVEHYDENGQYVFKEFTPMELD